MTADLWALYADMKRSRLFEEAVARLWHAGLISGEMHLGTGEEAIVAGVLAHLQSGDALALDHRSTSPLLMRGVDPTAILHELLGHDAGLCRGYGGHMHLYSKDHLTASSGIVGAAGPAAAGFALAAQYLRPGTVAVAFFGEGAVNQGMLLESLNLAAVWQLPALFVCKDDGWSITTTSDEMSGGTLPERVRGLGVNYAAVDGRDVTAVWNSARQALDHVRVGRGPYFLHATCVHLEAHFLGYQMVRVIRRPFTELPAVAWPLLRALLAPRGATLSARWAGLKTVLSALVATWRDPRRVVANDPVARARLALIADADRLSALETQLAAEITAVVATTVPEQAS